MIMQRGGFVYIITNKEHSVLYTGVTSDLSGRISDHKNKTYPKSFSAKYNCNKLVYDFFFSHIQEAIEEEKRIKDRSRQSKIDLINNLNPEWKDLYDALLND